MMIQIEEITQETAERLSPQLTTARLRMEHGLHG